MYNKDSYVYKYTECPLDGSILSQYITKDGENIFEILEYVDIIPIDWILENVSQSTEEGIEKIVEDNNVTYYIEEIDDKKYITTLELPNELIRYIEKFKKDVRFDEIITEKVSDFVEFLLERETMLKKLRNRIIEIINLNGYYNELRLKEDICGLAATDDIADMLKNCPLMAGHLKESLWNIMKDYSRTRDNYLNLDYFYGHDYKFNSVQEFYEEFNIKPSYMLQFENQG